LCSVRVCDQRLRPGPRPAVINRPSTRFMMKLHFSRSARTGSGKERTVDTARHHRWLPALGLLLLSPVCAEYLIGYDQIIGRPRELLAGLLILAPLYGAVAVMIREA